MASKLFKEMIDQVTPEEDAFVRMSIQIVKQIKALMKQHGMSQTDLANALDKSPSEVSKWLSGMHNFTLKSLANLEIVLGAPIIAHPQLPAEQPKPVAEKLDAIIADLSNIKREHFERAMA